MRLAEEEDCVIGGLGASESVHSNSLSNPTSLHPDTPDAEGVKYEKREFWGAFALEDKKEGMAAFVEKRPPNFVDA